MNFVPLVIINEDRRRLNAKYGGLNVFSRYKRHLGEEKEDETGKIQENERQETDERGDRNESKERKENWNKR